MPSNPIRNIGYTGILVSCVQWLIMWEINQIGTFLQLKSGFIRIPHEQTRAGLKISVLHTPLSAVKYGIDVSLSSLICSDCQSVGDRELK